MTYIAHMLTLIFITLKLLEETQVAAWSWWWVLSPSLLVIGIQFTLLVCLALGALLFLALDTK